MDTVLLQVNIYRTNEERAAQPHYAPHDGDPVTELDEAKEALIQVFKFHGEVQALDTAFGEWLVELPREPWGREGGYWVEGTDEYEVTCEWPD